MSRLRRYHRLWYRTSSQISLHHDLHTRVSRFSGSYIRPFTMSVRIVHHTCRKCSCSLATVWTRVRRLISNLARTHSPQTRRFQIGIWPRTRRLDICHFANTQYCRHALHGVSEPNSTLARPSFGEHAADIASVGFVLMLMICLRS